MEIKFWGVRGSIPCPGPETMKYGGNTSCIELRVKNPDRHIIIDAGSGIRVLGEHMMEHDLPKGNIETEIYLTHTHWDHIMGFPFFAPIYVPGTKIKIHGPVTYEEDSLEEIVGGQLAYRYFPVRRADLQSEIEYYELKEGKFDIGDGISMVTKYLNHPILVLGYRFEYEGKVFCTLYDTEPFSNLFITDPDDPSYDMAMAHEGQMVAQEENERMESFFSGVDLLVYDVQYTMKEYDPDKKGWGHSPVEYAIESAKRANVKRLALFHHDPVRTDVQLDEMSETYCSSGDNGEMEVFFAREGMVLSI
ncbi:MAG: MBL fold metallo-hydrolase [Desulfobacterales bacterium]|nr:MBL fold metallo-hydrolase [Desulfobacterales bacterium]